MNQELRPRFGIGRRNGTARIAQRRRGAGPGTMSPAPATRTATASPASHTAPGDESRDGNHRDTDYLTQIRVVSDCQEESGWQKAHHGERVRKAKKGR